MGSDLGFVQHVCDFVREVDDVSYKKMFGEYAVYVGAKVVALVCDNSLFVKPTEAGRSLLGSPIEAPPYPGSKPYFLVDEHLDDSELLSSLFRVTEADLAPPKAKKTRASRKGPSSA
ncbi:MAG TPA: TfoX/Sxy family protein [Longimicrobiales bacterium]|nr:TfoX/Sxy family protein [Longimicrobiales bacterium]